MKKKEIDTNVCYRVDDIPLPFSIHFHLIWLNDNTLLFEISIRNLNQLLPFLKLTFRIDFRHGVLDCQLMIGR